MQTQSPQNTEKTDLTVWFDGGCPICSREMRWMERQTAGRGVLYRDVRSAQDGPADAKTLLARFHVQDEKGVLISGAAAFAALWRRSRWLKPLGLAARWPPMLWVMETAYVAFLRFRPQLQRLAGAGRGDGRLG